MSPESARPRTAGASMPGLHRSLSFASGPASPLGEGPDHAEHVVDSSGSGWPSSRTAWCSALGQRPAQRLVGPRLELAGPPALADRLAAQRVEQHGLADPAQPGQHQRPLGTPPRHPLEHDVERRELLVAAGQLGRPLPGAGRVGIPDRVHDSDGIGLSSGFRRFRRAASLTYGRVGVTGSVTPTSAGYRSAAEPTRRRSGELDARRRRPVEARAQHRDQLRDLVDREPERRRADVVAPQREHDEVGLGVPADPERAVVRRGRRGRSTPALEAAGRRSSVHHAPGPATCHEIRSAYPPRLLGCPSCPRWKRWPSTSGAGWTVMRSPRCTSRRSARSRPSTRRCGRSRGAGRRRHPARQVPRHQRRRAAPGRCTWRAAAGSAGRTRCRRCRPGPAARTRSPRAWSSTTSPGSTSPRPAPRSGWPSTWSATRRTSRASPALGPDPLTDDFTLETLRGDPRGRGPQADQGRAAPPGHHRRHRQRLLRRDPARREDVAVQARRRPCSRATTTPSS